MKARDKLRAATHEHSKLEAQGYQRLPLVAAYNFDTHNSLSSQT
jgi:hypothetical protein